MTARTGLVTGWNTGSLTGLNATFGAAAPLTIQNDPATLVAAMGLSTHPVHLWDCSTTTSTLTDYGTSPINLTLTDNGGVTQGDPSSNLGGLICTTFAAASTSYYGAALASTIVFGASQSVSMLAVTDSVAMGTNRGICGALNGILLYETTSANRVFAYSYGGAPDSESVNTFLHGNSQICCLYKNHTANSFKCILDNEASSGEAINSNPSSPTGVFAIGAVPGAMNASNRRIALVAVWTDAGAEQDFAAGCTALNSYIAAL